MKLIRKLALALCLVLLSSSYSNAQNFDSTGNLITMNGWSGVTYPDPSIFNQCCSGGPGVAMNTGTNTLRFSYSQSTATQAIAINTAMAAAGTGVKVIGFNYSWLINNDLTNAGGTRGTLIGNVSLTGTDNTILNSYAYDYSNVDTKTDFVRFSGTETFGPQYDPSALKNLTVSFTGKDQNWWAGYYGPRVRDVDVRLNYMVDPCATNPAYSPSCAGFGSVLTSPNLGANYAIATALEHSGTGLIVHGFDYGFNWSTGQNCTVEFIICWEYGAASTGATAYVTNKQGDVISAKSYSWYSQNQSGSVVDRIRFPSSQNQLSLGNFGIIGGGEGGGGIWGGWSRMVYSADPCDKNPLYSPDCKKFVSTVLSKNSTSTTTTTTDYTTGVTTTSAVLADPVKSEPTNSSVGGVQLTTTGQVTVQDNIPQPVKEAVKAAVVEANVQAARVAGTPGSLPPKPKEPEKVVVKPVLQVQQASTTRKTQQDNSGVDIALSAAANSVQETAKTTGQSEVQQYTYVQQQVQQAPMATNKFVMQQYTPETVVSTGEIDASGNQMKLREAKFTATKRAVIEQVELPELPKELAAKQDEITTQTALGTGLMVSLVQTPVFKYEPRTYEVETVPTQSPYSLGRMNPLNTMTEPRYVDTSPEKTETVKRNVQPNSLAGDVELTAMAVAPQGFSSYINLTMIDAKFYETKEIYKNQRTVDNERVLRFMNSKSDNLHQQMVNQQYKIGN